MHITEVNISSEEAGAGLGDIKMSRLGQVVLLAGKNGSGKSRILNRVMDALNNKLTIDQLKTQRENVKNQKRNINTFEIAIATVSEDDPDGINTYKAAIQNSKQSLTISEEKLSWNLLQTDSEYNSYKGIPYVPGNGGLRNPNNENRGAIRNLAAKAHETGIINIANSALCKIQDLQDKWYEVTHQNSNAEQEEKDKVMHEYSQLKSIIEKFLNTELKRDISGDATIFGLKIGNAMLSDGQQALLKYAVAIHSHGASLDNIVLFMDEPEMSLHPSAIIEIIDKIIECIPNGQVWVATHSVPLLAHFDTNCIWFVENGTVSHAGKTPEKVLASLIGNEEERQKLSDFINLPAQLALSNHAFESLMMPRAVETSKNDPQTLQIREEILQHLHNKERLRLLDFGAGKGRLLANMIENDDNLDNLANKVDYVAYDEYEHDKKTCLSVLSKLYNDYEKRYYNDFNKLYEVHDKNSFDVVVLCNVLHEIDPAQWLDVFRDGGIISTILNENGILLLVEDHLMPVGEKPYEKGFIVLDTTELKDLFSIQGELPYNDARKDGRLKAHRINRSDLIKITVDTKKKALESIHNKARKKILDIRGKEANYTHGKEHGFWLQQYANTGLALSEL